MAGGLPTPATDVQPMPHAEGYVYLSGPIIGQTYASARYGWRHRAVMALLPGIRVLSPMRQEGHCASIKGEITNDNVPDHFFSKPCVLVEKDLMDIRRCDVVLVNLLGSTKVSIGTMVEIGMARALEKPIVTIIEPGNIHQHPFVLETSIIVVETLDDAIQAVNGLLSTGL